MSPESGKPVQKHAEARTIIIGGSGFLGSRLGGLLRESNLSFRTADLRKSVRFPDHSAQCDVRQLDSLLQAFRGATAIINLAAEHRDDVRPISRYFATNVQGAERVCEAARIENVKKIVFTSSAAVYGFTPTPAEEDGPFHPFNPYGETKLQAEGVYRNWAHEDPSRTLVIVRPTVIFGEGNRGNVYNLLRQIASRRFLMVGRGDNFKSMAYVDNVAAFIAYSLSFGTGIHVFNYADLPDMTTSELVNNVLKYLGRPARIRSLPLPVAMTAAHAFDLVAKITPMRFPISAIRIQKFCETTQLRADRVLQTGFVPPYSLREGLERTIRSDFLLTAKND